MTFDSYSKYDGLGLAELVATKAVKPEELLQAAIDRTEAVNPELNAVVLKHYEEAFAAIQAGLPAGPFQGVPFLLKDLYSLLEGTKTTNGSQAFADTAVSPYDSTLVARYKKAGLVIFGKTNTPELGLSVSTEPRLYGATRNPWNQRHSSGGSSGGAGAAVAAGLVPVAQASDGGGSIRIPASACGLFGLKPTRGRTPCGPDSGEGWSGLSISHVVGRSVRDSAAMLDATCGMERGAPYDAPAAPASFYQATQEESPPLRIAARTSRFDGSAPHEQVAKVFARAVTLCEDLGHTLQEDAPVVSAEELAYNQAVIIGAATLGTLESHGKTRGQPVEEHMVEHVTWVIAQAAKKRSSVEYYKALQYIHSLGRLYDNFMQNYDVIMTPVLGTPPPVLGKINMSTRQLPDYIAAIQEMAPYAGVFNMTGQPSMSVPLGETDTGLPVGIMFTGRFGEEALLLRFAAQLEKAAPWAARLPALQGK